MVKRLLPYILMGCILFFGSCSNDRQKAVKVGDKFIRAALVDVDFGVLMKYAVKEAAVKLGETYNELGEEGVANLRQQAKESKIRYKLNEERSLFAKSYARLVYEVRVGPDYDGFHYVYLEVLGHRGVWRVSFYTI